MPALSTDVALYLKRVRDTLRTGPGYSAAELTLGTSTSRVRLLAQDPGVLGNAITVKVTLPAGTSALTIVVSGKDITVELAVTGGAPTGAANTATLIAAAINASSPASKLVLALLPPGSGAAEITAAVPVANMSGGLGGSSGVDTNPLNFLRAQDMSSCLELLQDALDVTGTLTATSGSTTTVGDGAGTYVPGQQVGNLVKFKANTTTVALRGLSYRITANTDRLLTTTPMAGTVVNGDTYEIVGGFVDSAIAALRQGKGPADSPPGSVFGDYRTVQDGLARLTGSLGITQASGTLTLTGNAANTETVTIGSKIYTFQAVLTNVDGNVFIGASASDSLDNLIAAINLGAGSGTLYAAATTLHPSVRAAAGAGDTMVVTAKVASGAAGNGIATTETVTGTWAAATLVGGVSGVALRERSQASLLTGTGSTALNVVISTAAIGSNLRVDMFRGMRATISGESRMVVGNTETALLLDGPLSAAPTSSVAVAISIPEDASGSAMMPGRVHPGGQPGNNKVLADHLAQAQAAVVAFVLPV